MFKNQGININPHRFDWNKWIKAQDSLQVTENLSLIGTCTVKSREKEKYWNQKK